MALRKPTTTNTAAAFEQEPGAVADTAVAEREAPQKEATAPVTPTPAPAPEPTAAAKVESTTAIAKAASSSVATVKNFKNEVAAMQDAVDLSYGNFRVFKAKDGVIKEMKNDKKKLGRWVKVLLLSWSRHFEISPGEDGASSSDFVAYSADGITIDTVLGEELKRFEGRPVNEYLEYLRKEEDFDKASKREFIDTLCSCMGCEDDPDFNDAIQLTLSSSSIPAFKAYQAKLEVKAKLVAMGIPGHSLPDSPFQFYFIREDAENKRNQTWTKLRIDTTLPAKF